MKKIAIIYESSHHGNTLKLVDAIAEKYGVTKIDATKEHMVDLAEYDIIGFASGIDFGKFYSLVEQFLTDNLPNNKQVFFLYTCAKTSNRFTQSVKNKALEKNSTVLGEYGCKGYNTYGPWKLIGGMNKNHPNQSEIQEAIKQFESWIM